MFLRKEKCLFPPPFLNRGVVAGIEDVGDELAFEIIGLGVLGILQDPVIEGLVGQRLFGDRAI